MVVVESSSGTAATDANAKRSQQKKSMKSRLSLPKKQALAKADASSSSLSSPPRKRTKSPGVRVIGGRIYDSQHGTTCHQCRQKTMDFAASCKQVMRDKPCPIRFCHKCLLNRYGEKAEEVETVDNWSCPRCRGVCNCSFCMKKKGQQPTGILIHAAKAIGYSSVHELLGQNGSDVLSAVNGLKSLKGNTSPLCQKAPKRSHGKENSHDELRDNEPSVGFGGGNENDEELHLEKKKKKTTKKRKREAAGGNFIEFCESNAESGKEDVQGKGSMRSTAKLIEEVLLSDKKKPMQEVAKPHKEFDEIESDNIEEDVQRNDLKKGYVQYIKKEMLQYDTERRIPVAWKNDDGVLNLMQDIWMPQKDLSHNGFNKNMKESKKDSTKSITQKILKNDQRHAPIHENSENGEVKPMQYVRKCQKNSKDLKNKTIALVNVENMNQKRKHLLQTKKSSKHNINVVNILPQGAIVTEVAGTEWSAKDIGAALQFLEFCNAFSKVLDLKKGEAEYVLRELARGHVGRAGHVGRVGRRGYSPVANFHVKLLSIIRRDMGEKPLSYSPSSGDSWLSSLVKYLDEAECDVKELHLDCLGEDPLAYESLDTSKKLKVLNFLCDRALDTEKMRGWIDKENVKFIKRKKENTQAILSAKKKERDLKKKLHDDMAKAMLALREGAILTVKEHDNLISQIKAEAEKAHAEMLESFKLLPKKKQRRDAIRTDPVLLEGDGHVYWKLEGYCSNSKVILQDIGSWNSVILEDKWYAYGQEEEKAIEQHIFSSRSWRQMFHRSSKKERENFPRRDNKSHDISESPKSSAEGHVMELGA